MLHAKIETLGVDPQNGSVVVLLRTENDKLLPIVIGPSRPTTSWWPSKGKSPQGPSPPTSSSR